MALDGSGIEGKVGASAVTVFAPVPGEAAITLDREQAFLGPLTEFTVYSRELIGLGLASRGWKPHYNLHRQPSINYGRQDP